MSAYNILKNLNSYAGRNNASVYLGTTRNIKGSINRIYNYCSKTTINPLFCMFNIPNTIITGIFETITTFYKNLILQNQTPNRILQFDANKNLVSSNVTPTTATYIDTSQNIQTLINNSPILINNITGETNSNFKILCGNATTSTLTNVVVNFNPNFGNTPVAIIACVNSDQTPSSTIQIEDGNLVTSSSFRVATISNGRLVRDIFFIAFGLE
jgi:hypothetical protein